MKPLNAKRIVLAVLGGTGLAVLSACATKQAPPPPPPPPLVVIPPRPLPPLGASPALVPPPVGLDGTRQTVNTGISTAQITWNLRSAFNVAALNCLRPQHASILTSYRAFLKTHERKLNSVNRTVDREFKDRFGTGFVRPREAFMTQVYNYFALPPTLPAFCDAALSMAVEAQTVKSADLDAFAARTLPALDAVFVDFFRQYDAYRVDLAAWEARYGTGIGMQAQPAAITLPSVNRPALPQ